MIKINEKLTLIGFDDWANDHCAIFTENENKETYFAFNLSYEHERSKELGIELDERLMSEKIRESNNPQKGKIEQILELPKISIEINESTYEIFSNESGTESFGGDEEFETIRTTSVPITEVRFILDEYNIDYSMEDGDELLMIENEPREYPKKGNMSEHRIYSASLGIEENNFPIDSKELLKTILKKYGREY